MMDIHIDKSDANSPEMESEAHFHNAEAEEVQHGDPEQQQQVQCITMNRPILGPSKEEMSLLTGNDKFYSGRDVHGKPIDEKTAATLSQQFDRTEKLRTAVSLRKYEIAMLKREVEALREKLQPFPSVQLEKLQEENNQLRIECDLMTREVDKRTNGNVPLGETSENFYRAINPGQGVNALIKNITKNQPNLQPPSSSTSSSNPNVRGRYPTGSRNGKPPPPRPPPPKYLPIPTQFDTSSPDEEWNCTVCTFKNHPDLKECEQCAMVRFQPSPSSPSRGHY